MVIGAPPSVWQEASSDTTERPAPGERGEPAPRRRWGRFWARRSPDVRAAKQRPARRGLAVASSCAGPKAQPEFHRPQPMETRGAAWTCICVMRMCATLRNRKGRLLSCFSMGVHSLQRTPFGVEENSSQLESAFASQAPFHCLGAADCCTLRPLCLLSQCAPQFPQPSGAQARHEQRSMMRLSSWCARASICEPGRH